MDETELARRSVPDMLRYLHDKDLVSERKLRLFACACCRRIWHHLPDPRCERAVSCAERFADGLVSDEERDTAVLEMLDVYVTCGAAARAVGGPGTWTVLDSLSEDERDRYENLYQQAAEEAPLNGLDLSVACEEDAAAHAAYHALRSEPGFLWCAAPWAAMAVGYASGLDPQEVYTSSGDPHEVEAQWTLVWEFFGDPFRSVTADSSWLRWNDRTIPRIAQRIYDERAFDRLPILADALEDAGCIDAALLAHCRTPGPHVRGCWAVDLLLGKR